MKSILKKVLKYFVLIISILFFLHSILVIYFIGKFRECDRVKVTDNNRQKIVSMMEEAYDDYKDIPDMSRAKVVERRFFMHDAKLTVYYKDGTNYSFYLDRHPDYIRSYFINEGYNAYFRSMEFVVDLIKLVASFVILVVVAIKVLDL
ncbi:MAG: hypothetical protein IJ335_12070 [Lachnospiraceae bacterium]|nr:hypothetical protein [Lachnospiraceae bacterium]